jgi:cation:H+ antiporter
MPLLIPDDLTVAFAIIAGAALVIGFAGVRLTHEAERFATVMGFGQAPVGAVVLGGMTSLSGLVTSVAAAGAGNGDLAVANGVGGIAVQTVFLVVADAFYRRANLEHAAAAEANLLQGALLVCLLAMPLFAMLGPDVSFWSVHPVSPLLIAAYIAGVHLTARAEHEPQWRPVMTAETQKQQKDPPAKGPKQALPLIARLLVLGGLVAVAGFFLSQAGAIVSEKTAIGQTAVGSVLTATTTSLPELVTAVAAVRRGALALAVGDILGGNCFDVLFLSVADLAYRDGSLFHAVSGNQGMLLSMTILMTGILLLGMFRRERHGVANIGFESALVVSVYAAGMALVFVGSG